VRVALVEPPGQRGYVPIAAAYLAATSRADPEIGPRARFDLELSAPGDPLDDALGRILDPGPPDVLALSCQGWSLARAAAIASRVSAVSPDTLIVFGGNHVSSGGRSLLAERPYVDVVVDGEGEFTFLELLKTWRRVGTTDALGSVSGLTVRCLDGSVASGPERPRIADLSQVVSPYLSGQLDEFLSEDCTALLETNRGCPYSCSFCYWGEAIGARVHQFPLERVRAEMRYLAERRVDAWYICDANFGMFERDTELVDYMVRLRAEFGYPKTMHTNWAKSSNERVVTLCAKLNHAGIHSTYTLALQSATTDALRLANRKNMKINRVEELAGLCRQHCVVPRGELIWGLPGESYPEFRESFDVLAPHTDALSVYPHYLLPNTEFTARMEELGLRAEKKEMDTDYAYCVEHPAMSYAEFLEGMRFIISNNILRVASGFYRLFPRVAMAALDLSYASSTESLGEWIPQSQNPVARRFARFYRIPLTTHRQSLVEVWAAIHEDRDGFLGMLRSYVSESLLPGFPQDKADVAMAAFEFDALTFPLTESGTGYRERIVELNYDLVSVQRGECSLPPARRRVYRVRWPLGLLDYPVSKWYFGLMSFAAEVTDITAGEDGE
jgi:radical SAM C-methyltransferase